MTDDDRKTGSVPSEQGRDQTGRPALQPGKLKSLWTVASAAGDTSLTPGVPPGEHFGPVGSPIGGAPPLEFGRYRLLRTLGQGAMGTVYLAEDTHLHRQVALKIPQLGDKRDGPRLERFYREARLAATLQHPNMCPIYDVGELQGTHFISMAYVQGRPLSTFLNPENPLSERSAAALVRKMALALHEAHSHGVIHRDLKPANIMIDQRGEPIIMDFGLARQSNSIDQVELTQTGAVLGTPAYMSPEQVQGKKGMVGPAADIYGLGSILYELLTGRVPFDGTVVSILAQIATQPAPRPSMIRPDLNPFLEAICLKAIAKSINDRHASMAELATELTQFLHSHQNASDITESEAGAPTMRSGADPNAKSEPFERFRAFWFGRSRATRRMVVLGAGALSLVWGIMLFWQTTPDAIRSSGAMGRSSASTSNESPETTSAANVTDAGSAGTAAQVAGEEKTPESQGEAIQQDRAGSQTGLVPVKPYRQALHVAGSWHIDGDELVQTGGWGGIIQFGDPLWQDYDFSFEVVKIDGPYGAAGRFRFFDWDNSLEFDLGAGGNKIYGLAARVPSNARFNAVKNNVSMQQDHNYRMLIKARGDQFTCYLDDEFIFSCHDDRFPRGAVGFTTCQTTARFSQIKVTDPEGRLLWTGLPELPVVEAP